MIVASVLLLPLTTSLNEVAQDKKCLGVEVTGGEPTSVHGYRLSMPRQPSSLFNQCETIKTKLSLVRAESFAQKIHASRTNQCWFGTILFHTLKKIDKVLVDAASAAPQEYADHRHPWRFPCFIRYQMTHFIWFVLGIPMAIGGMILFREWKKAPEGFQVSDGFHSVWQNCRPDVKDVVCIWELAKEAR